jgi:hypothetical protein
VFAFDKAVYSMFFGFSQAVYSNSQKALDHGVVMFKLASDFEDAIMKFLPNGINEVLLTPVKALCMKAMVQGQSQEVLWEGTKAIFFFFGNV